MVHADDVPLTPMPPEVDLSAESLKDALDRVVQIVTQTEEGTVVPLGTGALILKDIIVTARHTVVDSDGVYLNPLIDGQEVEFLIASPVADLALLKLPGGSIRASKSQSVRQSSIHQTFSEVLTRCLLAAPKTVRPFCVAISAELKVRKQVAVLGYPLKSEPNTDSKLMLRQGRIVDISHTADRAFCTKFEGEKSGLIFCSCTKAFFTNH